MECNNSYPPEIRYTTLPSLLTLLQEQREELLSASKESMEQLFEKTVTYRLVDWNFLIGNNDEYEKDPNRTVTIKMQERHLSTPNNNHSSSAEILFRTNNQQLIQHVNSFFKPNETSLMESPKPYVYDNVEIQDRKTKTFLIKDQIWLGERG